MKRNKLIVSGLMVLMLLVSGMALAEKSNDHHNGDKKEDWSDFRMMMTDRHKMMVSMMNMQKKTMEILQGLNHKPSASEKKKLGKMIVKLGDMIAEDKAISKKMMKKWNGDSHHKGSW